MSQNYIRHVQRRYKELSFEETVRDIRSSWQYCCDEGYILWTAKTTPSRGKRVVQIMSDHFYKEDKILDVGTSQGLTMGYMAQVFTNIEGTDIDMPVLKTARKRLKKLGLKVKLSHYDGKKLPYANNTFDGIISTEVFEHVNNRQNFVKELHRVLKSSGKLIISSPNKLYPIECEFHLPFLSYLPRRWADIYIRFSKRGNSYDGIDHPTYSTFKRNVSKYFSVNDVTFQIIKHYKKYYLDEERGFTAFLASRIVDFNDRLQNSLLSLLSQILSTILINVSPGWFFVCTKKSNLKS